MTIDWNHQLTQQLDWHWRENPRPRFGGLTDEIAVLRDLYPWKA
jgi:hypothetical protein